MRVERRASMELYKKKEDCCGCGACMNACPKNAISMRSDEYGYIYPHVDHEKCVECGLCTQSCRFSNSETTVPQKVYAAANQKCDDIMNAASGGVFTAVASEFLKNGGAVFGAALSFNDGHASVKHIQISSINELWKLQGSKYVQSEIGFTYRQAKNCLQSGQRVLFSGTPCQIAGLKSFLRRKYDNLYTVDLICHGVPSSKLFDDYIQQKNTKLGAITTNFKFRDKKCGWGENTSLEYTKDNQNKVIYSPARLESYCSLFLDGVICRENCYSCPFAKSERIGDITIGDYWGIEVVHPELLDNPEFEESKGISCILVNSAKGQELCDSAKGNLSFYKSSIDKVVAHNKQLRHPSLKPQMRDLVSNAYKHGGYLAVEKIFISKYKKQLLIHFVYNKIPRKLRIKLKKVISKE